MIEIDCPDCDNGIQVADWNGLQSLIDCQNPDCKNGKIKVYTQAEYETWRIRNDKQEAGIADQDVEIKDLQAGNQRMYENTKKDLHSIIDLQKPRDKEIESFKRNIKHLEGINGDCVKELYKHHEEIEKLKEIIECKNTLLIAYRLGTNRGVGKALDKLEALGDGNNELPEMQ